MKSNAFVLKGTKLTNPRIRDIVLDILNIITTYIIRFSELISGPHVLGFVFTLNPIANYFT